jgi:putative ABC transport system substrate-binding protein
MAPELTPKRLEILKATFPGVRRVWAVYDADDLSSGAAARKAQEVAAVLKLDVVAQAVRTRDELVSHLKTLRSGDALLAPPGLTLNIPGVILDLALMSRWPALFSNTFWVQAGALVSYGSDPYAEGVQAARLVARILRGERPQDLPVEGANRIELAINLKTARSMGITIPRDILVRADRVIE